MDERTPLLEIENLHMSARRGDVSNMVLKDIHLTLKSGEILGLVGESGAGKSTLGLAALGYTRAGCSIDAGSIRLKGLELTDMTGPGLRQVWGPIGAYVAQSAAAAFNPAHRLMHQVVEGTMVRAEGSAGSAEEKAQNLFRALRLPMPETFGRKYPHQVSGGQLQRAMTAMALMGEPEMLVFDEPTTALDVTTQVDFLVAVKDTVKRLRTAALYISHDLAVVAQMADRIIVLRHGEVVEEGTTDEIMRSPRKDYTRTLWAVKNIRQPEREAKQGSACLTLKNVNVHYGKIAAVRDVSIAVRRGQTLGIVGESGSGKTTLGRAIMGLITTTSGDIRFDEKLIPASYKKRGPELLRKVQLVHQTPDTALNPRRKVGDIIRHQLERFGQYRSQDIEEKAGEVFDLVELPRALMDRFPSQLSGGQKQRVCLARALAADPECIVLDEVTSALDQLVAENIIKLLLDLQKKRSIAYIFISHDFSSIRAMSHDVAVMKNGSIVESGDAGTIFANPQHPYTQSLLGSIPEMRIGWLEEKLARH
ncbi:ABC transporter ATP-binding protein [Ochrobactrum sp. C6C9]|nr:ABC transporter ATP-binding protein [Ochrobactrum sp. C6C9]